MIGKEFAQRLGKFDERRFQNIKAVKFINGPDFCQHCFCGGHIQGVTIGKAAWQMGFGQRAGGLLGLGHGRAGSFQKGFKSRAS